MALVSDLQKPEHNVSDVIFDGIKKFETGQDKVAAANVAITLTPSGHQVAHVAQW